MLILFQVRRCRDLDFSIFLSHETVPFEVMALAQEQVCADHIAVLYMDTLL